MTILKKSGCTLVAALIVLVLLGVSWVAYSLNVPDLPGGSIAPPRGDTELSEFYTLPDELPKNPGVLINQEILEGSAVLANAGENIRLMYSSTEGIGGKNRSTVSGALYLPKGTPPDGGWPLLVWSHGTVGIGDKCAPSFAGRSDRDRTYLNPWLENGFAIAASDYQGLGMPGTHPYMDSRTMAYNNLDLIRAVQTGGFPLSKQVLISGQSQGATGVIATAGFAKDYASDVKLDGIIATGIPYFSNNVIMGLATSSDPDAVTASLPLSLYMLALTEMIDPDFSLDEILSEKAKPVVASIGDQCVFDFIQASEKAGLSPRSTFTSRTELALIKAFNRMKYPALDFETPILTGSGTEDKITPFAMQSEFIDDACAAGANLVASTYDGANHNQGLLQSGEDAFAFAKAVLSGGEIKSTCPGG